MYYGADPIEKRAEVFYLDSENSTLKGVGVGIRFVALLIDGLVFLPVSYILALLMGTTGSNGFQLDGLGFWVSSILGFCYYFFFEGKLGATLGKMAVGLKVIKVDGGPCDMQAAAIRTLLRIIDALPFAYLIGVISIWVTELNQRLGDRAAGTIVVRGKSLG